MAAGARVAVATGPVVQPVDGLVDDDRVEVAAGVGAAHEVDVIALPVEVAVGGHVGRGAVAEVPLAQIAGSIPPLSQQAADGGDGRVERGVGGEGHVVDHAVLGQIAARVQAGPRRRARRGVGEVAVEAEPVGPQPLVGGQVHHPVEPVVAALLVRHDQQDVRPTNHNRTLSALSRLLSRPPPRLFMSSC